MDLRSSREIRNSKSKDLGKNTVVTQHHVHALKKQKAGTSYKFWDLGFFFMNLLIFAILVCLSLLTQLSFDF